MKFATRTSPPIDRGEVCGGKELVERHGYIPLKRRIEDMMAAGQRLADYRAGLYDYDEQQDPEQADMRPDPTREPGYDLADASRDALDAGARIAAAVKAKKEAARQATKDAGAPAAPAAGDVSGDGTS